MAREEGLDCLLSSRCTWAVLVLSRQQRFLFRFRKYLFLLFWSNALFLANFTSLTTRKDSNAAVSHRLPWLFWTKKQQNKQLLSVPNCIYLMLAVPLLMMLHSHDVSVMPQFLCSADGTHQCKSYSECAGLWTTVCLLVMLHLPLGILQHPPRTTHPPVMFRPTL